MPYIDKTLRMPASNCPSNPGELNYNITNVLECYRRYHSAGTGDNYALFNEMIGALECAKLELYRRIVAEYEDVKRNENGEVYSPIWRLNDGKE